MRERLERQTNDLDFELPSQYWPARSLGSAALASSDIRFGLVNGAKLLAERSHSPDGFGPADMVSTRREATRPANNNSSDGHISTGGGLTASASREIGALVAASVKPRPKRTVVDRPASGAPVSRIRTGIFLAGRPREEGT